MRTKDCEMKSKCRQTKPKRYRKFPYVRVAEDVGNGNDNWRIVAATNREDKSNATATSTTHCATFCNRMHTRGYREQTVGSFASLPCLPKTVRAARKLDYGLGRCSRRVRTRGKVAPVETGTRNILVVWGRSRWVHVRHVATDFVEQ